MFFSMPLKGFEGDPGMPYNGVDFVEALNSTII